MLQHEYANLEGPEPKEVDVPQRRSSLSCRPGGDVLIAPPDVVGPDFEDTPPPPLSRKELARQKSEAELLASVGGLSAVSSHLVLCIGLKQN